jgi:hypothetical protein
LLGVLPDREFRRCVARYGGDVRPRGFSCWDQYRSMAFPRQIRKGLNKGELHWVRAEHSRILQVLHNPRYAGAFVYGRVRTRLLPDGKHSTTKVPRSEWQFVIPNVYVGYITWAQFEANQKRIADNALGFGAARKAGPAREGPALLQGRVLCGICGERMSIRYSMAYQQVVPTYVCQEASIRRAEKVCQSVPGRAVDQAISNLLLDLMQPMTLRVAIAVQQEVEARVTETDTLRRKHVETVRCPTAGSWGAERQNHETASERRWPQRSPDRGGSRPFERRARASRNPC